MAGEFFGTSPEIDARKKYALSILQQSADTSPKAGGPLAALARALTGGIGGYIANQAEQDDDAAGVALANNLPGLGGGMPTPAAPAPMASGTPTAPMPSADTSTPRGYRNNNPLNIEAGSFTSGQPGFSGSDGRFAKFGSMDQGISAADRLLASYAAKGLTTPTAIINRWAPPGENDSRGYAASVAGRLGISPDTPITPEMRPKLIAAMAQFENGKPLPQQPGQQPYQVAGPAVAPPGAVGPQQTAQAVPPQAPQQQMTPPGGPAPNRSPVQMPPEVAASVNRLLKKASTRPLGTQLYLQYAKPVDQWTQERNPDGSIYQRNAVTGEMKAVEKSDVLPDAAVKQKIDIAAAGKPNTTINNTVNPVLKGIGDRYNAAMDAAEAATPQIQAIHEARRALDSGAFTGALAGTKLDLSKVGQLFGLPQEAVVNTEVLRSSLGSQVLDKAKTLGTNPSNTDRDYIEKVVGGKIELNEGSMRRLLDMQEGWARSAVQRANAHSKRLLEAQPEEFKAVAPMMNVPEPIKYEDYIKQNPVKPSTAAPSGVDPAALEEAKRRGLIK